MNILIFGAGSTGRGHLGVLLYEAGIRNLTFVEKNRILANELKKAKRYTLRYVGSRNDDVVVNGFCVYDGSETNSISNAICSADLVLTAVIAENLPDVARTFAADLRTRRERGVTGVLNVIACENLNHASSVLKHEIYRLLDPEMQSWCNTYIGFPDAIISRVVPVYKEDPLLLVAEDYNEWVVDRPTVKGTVPDIPCIDFVDNLDARLEKKLWIHNGGHATVAYAGHLYGHKYIHEALKDERVASLGGAAMHEIGSVIAHKHGFDIREIREYEYSLVLRGAIEEMKDDILRVVRDPIRKLGLADRLLGPAIYASQNQLPYHNIARSVVNVLRYFEQEDTQSVQMRSDIDKYGCRHFLAETIGLSAYPDVLETILQIYEENVK